MEVQGRVRHRFEFTDGGATVGTLDLDLVIPAGAIVMYSTITAVTGFAGDTIATLQIGDGTTVDRYNTGTPSVFATATTVDAGAVSGTAYHSGAKTVKLTITSSTDFTAVKTNGLGVMTIGIYYIKP